MSTIIRNHRGENRETRSHQSTKQATRGGPPAGGGGVQRFSSQLSAPFGEKPAGFFFSRRLRGEIQRFLLSAPLRSESQCPSRRPSAAAPRLRLPLPGPRHALLAGSGFWRGFYNHASNKHTHTTPSQLLLLTCHRTRNRRRFCISVWSFLSRRQPHSRSWTRGGH
jgi:hypothetical protein